MIRMGRATVVAAVVAIMGTFWATGLVAAQAAGSGAGFPEAVVSHPRAAPGEGPHRHVLAGRIDHLIDRVVALNEHYGWTWSHTGALIAFLEEAFIDLDDGRPGDAADQLRTFRDRVSTGLAEGTLTPEAGGPLLAATADLLVRVEALDPAGSHGAAPAAPVPVD